MLKHHCKRTDFYIERKLSYRRAEAIVRSWDTNLMHTTINSNRFTKNKSCLKIRKQVPQKRDSDRTEDTHQMNPKVYREIKQKYLSVQK